MRRVLASAGAAGLALLLTAPLAHADTVPSQWANSKSTTDTSVSSGSFDITAEFRRAHPLLGATEFSVHTSLTIPSGLDAGCGTAGDKVPVTTTGEEPADGVYVSTAAASVTCNGRYDVLIDGQMVNKGGTKKPIDTGAQLTPTVEVRMRPANVPSAHAAFGDGKVAISWDAVEDKTPDFLGYQVQIAQDDTWKTVEGGEVTRDSTFLVVSAPDAGTDAVYRVRARRDAPGGDVYSADAAETDKITIPTTSTTTPGSPPVTNPDGTPNPGGGGTGTGSGSGTGTGTGSGGTTHKGRNFDTLPPGIVGVGTKAPRVGIPQTGNVPGLLNDQDSGYKQELDYGDQQLAGGEDDGDGLSSFTYEDGGNGRGMAVPVATGLVLAAWAFHLRYLARAAKPAKKPRRRPVQPRGGWA